MAIGTRDRGAVDRLGQVLAACVDTGAHGVYELVAESPTSVYLVDGTLTYAESGSTPGLGARLVAAHRLSQQEWIDLRARAVGGSRISALLIQAAIVTEAEFAALIHSATIDALFHLITVPGREPLRRAGSPPRSDWVGSGVRLEIPDALRTIARLCDQVTDLGVRPGQVPTSTGLPQAPVTLSSDEWSVIWRIDGRSTIQELAWDTGLGVIEALLATGRLAETGLCQLSAAGQPVDSPKPTTHENRPRPRAERENRPKPPAEPENRPKPPAERENRPTPPAEYVDQPRPTAQPADRPHWLAPTVRRVQEPPPDSDAGLRAVRDSPDEPEPPAATAPNVLPRRGARPRSYDAIAARPGDSRVGKSRLADVIPEPLTAPDPELLRRVLGRLRELG